MKTPAFEFKPFSLKQKKLLTWWTEVSPYHDYDMVIADGAIRSGKTIAMIDSFLTWSLFTFQYQAFIIAGRSMGALKRNVLRPMFQILAAKGIPYRYHRSEHYVQIGTNTYYCFGANNEASQDVLQGLTAAGALADEVALFPQSFVEQMIGRCSVEGSKLFWNCNPEGPYHHIKTDYIDKAAEKRILHLHFELSDNPSLSPRVRERYRRMFSGLYYRRYILGLWTLAEGAVYDMWDDALHVVDVAPARISRLFVGVDYGTSNPTAFLLIAQAGRNLYVLDEYYWDSSKTGRQKTDAEYSADLRKWLAGRRPQAIVVDPSAASFIAQLRKDGFSVRQADNSVLDGIRNVATHLSDGRLFVLRQCTNLIREFGAYVWDTKAQERGEDKPVKAHDHALDALRYLIQTIFRRPDSGAVAKHPAW